jgi:dihydrofolate synthase/folylpolyglutamate synthase
MRFKTLGQWLDWQATLHPREIDLGLERVASVWQRLKPEGLHSLVVTVAGTNGKGSSVALLESIYRQAGYRVGAYTSPHLVRYNERIRINGNEVSDESLCLAFEMIDRAREQTILTYFEFATLAALILFAEQALDLVILEVGLGGRLDAVNIIDADVALITTVDLDHTEWLGSSRQQIGLEKAGIMRANRPAVIGDSAIPESVLQYARSQDVEIHLAGRDFEADRAAGGWRWRLAAGDWLKLPLPNDRGEEHINNASAVMMVCELLQSSLPLGRKPLSEGICKASLRGRVQLIEGAPSLLLDVAHNTQSVTALKDYLDRYDWPGQVHALFGLLKDKDAETIVNILRPGITSWHLLDLPGNRGRSAQELAALLQQAGVDTPVFGYHDFPTAFKAARRGAESQDLILIFGSFLIVGDALQYLDAE